LSIGEKKLLRSKSLQSDGSVETCFRLAKTSSKLNAWPSPHTQISQKKEEEGKKERKHNCLRSDVWTKRSEKKRKQKHVPKLMEATGTGGTNQKQRKKCLENRSSRRTYKREGKIVCATTVNAGARAYRKKGISGGCRPAIGARSKPNRNKGKKSREWG